MTFKHALETAFIGLAANKLRSLLTILGIVIGITAIILVMSVGRGAEALILNQVKSLGAETIIIEPGREPKGPSDFVEIFTDSLRPRDIEALKQPANVPGLQDAEPVVFLTATASFGNETKRARVRGGTTLVARILGLKLTDGFFYTEDDIKQRASVAVIGAKVASDLFGENASVAGEKFKIKNRLFRVIGVLASRGQGSFFDTDEAVFIPYTTAQQYLSGTSFYNSILVRAKSVGAVSEVAGDIKLTLRETHNITDPDKDDFHVTTQEDIASRIGSISTILSVLLVSIAAISLVVGGIGIMNIMLVSVTERTREIGLRKAVGATNRDILTQFLLEAVLLTVIGGAVGIILGALFSLLASVILTRVANLAWTFVFPVSAAMLGLSVAAVIGLGFGLYPARRAAKKDPIEALRYE